MKLTSTGKLAKEYLKKYPKLPIMTIAKIMLAENELHFNTKQARRTL